MSQRELCPQPKEFYREDAKVAKLREEGQFQLRANSRLRGKAFEDNRWSGKTA